MNARGRLGEPFLNDLLLGLNCKASSTDVQLERHGECGLIALRRGELVHATIQAEYRVAAPVMTGSAAVYGMLSWPSGSYRLLLPSDPIERTIVAPLKDLLLEGSRRFDDIGEIRRRLPPADTVLDIVRLPLGVMTTPLSPVELTVLSEVDGRRTLEELLEQSVLGVALCGQAILRLLSIDLVRAKHGMLVAQLFDRDLRTVFPVHQALWRRMLGLLNPLLETPNANDPLIAEVLRLCTGNASVFDIAKQLDFSQSQVLSAIDLLIANKAVSLIFRDRADG
jgi:hypothetical protein